MKSLDHVLRFREGGVYRAAVAGLALPPSAVGRVVHLHGPADKAQLLQAFARSFGFPAWFGDNWDALEEALGDLTPPSAGLVLRLSGLEGLDAMDAGTVQALLELLDDVARDWAGRGDLLVVLVEGTGPVTDRLEPIGPARAPERPGDQP
ncbi:MAG: barstar family protein [Betaproteobacteria bacterium]|jgi:hypothetical protein